MEQVFYIPYWFVWYYFVYGLLSSAYDTWPDTFEFVEGKSERRRFASLMMSVVHAIGILYVSANILLDEDYGGPLTGSQEFMLRFGLGYFIAHSIWMIGNENKLTFLAHHIFASCGLGGSLYLNKLGYIMATAYFMAELTNPPMLLWQISREYGFRSIYEWISPIYTAYFIGVRCFIAPVMTYYLNAKIFQEEEVSVFWKYFICIQSTALNIAGFVWSYWLIQGYMRFIRPKGKRVIIVSEPNDADRLTIADMKELIAGESFKVK